MLIRFRVDAKVRRMKAVLVNKTDDLGHHGCTLVNRQIELLAANAGISIVAKFPIASDWDALAPEEFDVVIVNGEGTLHSSSKGAERIAQVPEWAARRGKPAFLINTVYQNNSPQIAREIAKFQRVFVRDERSAMEAANDGIDCSVVPDLSLTWETPPARGEGNPIVNGSTMKPMRRKLYALSSARMPYLPILAAPIGRGDRSGSFRMKRLAALAAMPGLWRARNRNAIPDFDAFIAHLRTNVSGIITGRFHMATIALCLEIPVVAVASNTHKMEALFEALGMQDRLVPASQIKKAPDLLAPYRSHEIVAIRDMRRLAKAEAKNCFSIIAQTKRDADFYRVAAQ